MTEIIDVIDLGKEYWTKHLLSKIPEFWSSDDAKKPPTDDTPSGGLYGLMAGIASMLEKTNQDLVYAYDATRIQTATDEALDLSAQDFFGFSLPRKIGEPDEAYRARILAALLESKVARDPVQSIVELFTGATVRMLQADSPRDCGAFGRSFYNVDSALFPARAASTFHPNKGFMDVQLPAQHGPVPRYGFNAGAAYNAYTGVAWIATPANLITPQDVKSLVESVVAWPMQIAIRFAKTILPQLITGLVEPITAGLADIRPRLFPPFGGIYYVFATSGSASAIWCSETKPNNFRLEFGALQPPDSILSYLVMSRGVPNGARQVGILPNKEDLPVPYDTANRSLAVLPNWNCTPYISSTTPNGATLSFRTASPGATLNILTYPHGPYAGRENVAQGAGTHQFNCPTGPNFIVLITPNWGTDVGVNPHAIDTCDLTFTSVAPDTDNWFDWIAYPLSPALFYGNTTPILLEHSQATAQIITPVQDPFATFVNCTYPANAWISVPDLLNCSFETNLPMPDDETLHFLLLSRKIVGANTVSMIKNSADVTLTTNLNLNVVVASGNWNTGVYSKTLDFQTVKLQCSTGAPEGGAILSYLIYPKGVNAGRISVPVGRLEFTFDGNSDEFHIPLVTPNWNTTYSVIPLPNNLVKVRFTIPAPVGASFDYVTFPLT